MHLSTLGLKNYRACRETTVQFSPDLTVLVGENASGKSAVIDALRLITFPTSGRQTAWFNTERDLSRGIELGQAVEISARYSDLTETEKALYIPQLVDPHEDLIYTAGFATGAQVPRRNVLTWTVGDLQAVDPEAQSRRRIAHVYLPPLRDAVRDIDGGDQTQLYEVLKILIGTDGAKEDDFVNEANERLKDIAQHQLAIDTRNTLQSFFAQTMAPNREHILELNQRKLELRRLARLLRLQLSEADVPVGDIAATGLGYANLLFISMIVLQLVKATESDLTLLLVEEPEAHLHPQLQLVLLAFLRDQAEASGQVALTSPHPAVGKVQVIVTTHSPTLASTVSIRNVVVVARDSEMSQWNTRATALSQLGLSNVAVRKLDRYLTVTRAALLFARDVILVEGVAEMLLLPVLAAHRIRSTHIAGSTTAGAQASPAVGAPAPRITTESLYRQFRSTTIINVESVDFEPYLRLLLGGLNLRVDRVVVITDGDPVKPTIKRPSPISAGLVRRSTYMEMFPKAVTESRLFVEVGATTLEAEMFREKVNEPYLRHAFLELHPGSAHHWDKVATAAEDMDGDERAAIFAQAIKATSPSTDPYYLDIGKGDFAHVIADALEMDKAGNLTVPPYLAKAIDAILRVDPEV